MLSLDSEDVYFKSLYPIAHHNLCLAAHTHRRLTAERELYIFMCVRACTRRAVKAGVPDGRERIRRLECKTLLDLSVTFEAKSLAHICPSWVMIQLVTPLEC